ncbi:MAG: long-chain N-acyl amino acid synthase [Desulfobacterales bacterium]|nr:MAG: long-chain N-acyl amino acid synthase [Desulfobacterales bacterium]
MIRNSIQYGKFTFGIVDDDTLLKEIFRLRFQVFVEEFGFENETDHPGGLETDEYENEAIHCVCLNEEKAVVGTIRLILDSDKGFPIERVVSDFSFFKKIPDRKKIAEISRLTIRKDHRKRKENKKYRLESYNKKSKVACDPVTERFLKNSGAKRNPIILGLYQIIYQESKRQGITEWYMITEKRIYNELNTYGFHFHQIGEPVQYHGKRIPFFGIISEIEQYQIKNNPDMTKTMLKGLDREYHPHFTNNDQD